MTTLTETQLRNYAMLTGKRVLVGQSLGEASAKKRLTEEESVLRGKEQTDKVRRIEVAKEDEDDEPHLWIGGKELASLVLGRMNQDHLAARRAEEDEIKSFLNTSGCLIECPSCHQKTTA